MKNRYQEYKKTSIQSASRERLLLMMYEGAIRFVKKALVAAETKNIPEKATNITRAYDVIMELYSTLDHKVGGEIAAQLEQLYLFLLDELLRANVDNNIKHLQDVLRILETLYDGWCQAVEKLKTDKTYQSNKV